MKTQHVVSKYKYIRTYHNEKTESFEEFVISYVLEILSLP